MSIRFDRLDRRRMPLLIYNPQNASREVIKHDFGIRHRQFNTIWKDVLHSTMEHAEQHFLVQGQRGSGKTTLLLKVAYEIEDHPDLSSWLIPIIFREEEYAVNSLPTLWETIAQSLEEHSRFGSTFQGLAEALDKQYDQIPPEDQGRTFFQLLHQALQVHEKKIIVFIDNIGQIFNMLSEHEEKVLREILMTSNSIRIVAASSDSLEAQQDYERPFYQFFKVITLEGLKQKEAEQFLLRLGEFAGEQSQTEIQRILDTQPGKAESLRRLTGGVPRTIVLLFEIFLEGAQPSAYAYLEKLIDGVTPLYKHRVEDLAKSQRALFHAIAMNWDGISVKELKARTRMESKLVSAQLKKLESNWILEKRKTTTKNHIYFVRERFFNIWYLMRYGRKRDCRRVIWLTRFFETWCSSEELMQRTHRFRNSLQDDDLSPQGVVLFASALAQAANLPVRVRFDVVEDAKQFLEKSGNADLIPGIPNLYPELNQLLEEGKYEDAEQILRKLAENGESNACFQLARFYDRISGKIEEAEKFYLKAAEKRNIKAFVNLGSLYYRQEKYEEAEKFFLEAYKENDEKVLNNLGLLYVEQKKYEEAEKIYLEAIRKNNPHALNSLAILYEKIQKYEEAEKFYLKAIEKNDVHALTNLGILYKGQKKYKEAEQLYLRAIEKNDEKALNNLANLYRSWGRYEEAEEYYLKAIENEKNNIKALNNLADLYIDQGRYEEAEEYYLKVIENEKNNIKALYNLIVYYDQLGRYEKIEELSKKGISEDTLLFLLILAWGYFDRGHREQNKSSLELAYKAYKKLKQESINVDSFYSIITLWNDEFRLSIRLFHRIIDSKGQQFAYPGFFRDFFFLLLAKGQYYAAHKLFQNNDLKERFKPFYYALMHYLKDEYPNETLKMGPELKETVEEIKERVKKWRKAYT